MNQFVGFLVDVPEPSRVALTGFGIAGLLIVQGWHRKYWNNASFGQGRLNQTPTKLTKCKNYSSLASGLLWRRLRSVRDPFDSVMSLRT